MPYIQLRDRQYPIGQGQLRVGTSAYADVRVPGPETDIPQALVDVGTDAQAAIRRGSPEAVVKVNGVVLGPEPTPLIHGDKIEIGGVELLFGDDRSAGSTQYLGGPRAALRASALPPERATAATGGRLVSLVDGREYAIPAAGVTIGRDASCEIVVPSTEVSRRHAMISSGEQGYILSDLSTNGVLVNGERVSRMRTLGRGDLIRVGGEEFRFHADAVPVQPTKPSAEAAPAPSRTSPEDTPVLRTAAPASPAAEAPSAGGEQPIHPAAAAEAASGAAVGAGAARARPALAVLEIVNEGLLKGKRFEIRVPLTHIGRGEHNDICIADDSVSDSHAKIQKRETGWYVVDMGSTNGTYVGGRRISGEKHLVGSPDIRFGGIKMIFQVASEPVDDAKGTRAIAGMRPSRPVAVRAVNAAVPEAAAEVVEVAEEKAARGLGWVWIGVMVLVVGTVFFVLWGRP